MRKLLSTVCVLASCGAATTAVAGCGGDDAVPFDVAEASAATAKKGTARMTVKITMEGVGLPLPLSVDAKGVTALDEPKGRLTMDFKPLLRLAGAPPSTPGDVEVRFDGAQVYVKPPKVEELPIPGGKQWVAVDIARVAAAAGLPTKSLGKLFSIEPAAQLRALKAAKGLKEIGKEDVAGAETTHYRGTFKLSDYIATLPAGERAEVKQGLEKLDALSGDGQSYDDPVPADMWVDDDGVTRKLLSTQAFPAQNDQPGGKITQSYVLSDFGTPLDVTAPPADQTYDATKAASDAAEQAAAKTGATTS